MTQLTKYIQSISSRLIIAALLLGSCAKDQNSFLPPVKINLMISLVNYNFLTIPGNSIVFQSHGVKGIIVVCINPDLTQYSAYDACCPNEKDYSGIVTVQPVKNLVTPPYTVFASDFFGICNVCGSKFNLMGGGQPVKGPATHYLQQYNVVTGFESLTVIH
ncbi:MAG: hypothetical protein NTV75_00450 [Bacteroidia bacterium]|jgi:hypothetical protein|nr:hypothetical protein [Bacteroidia bacterium]